MNLTLLLLIPMLTALVILTCRDLFSVRWVAFIGSVIQLALGGMLLVQYNAARAAGNTAQMLFESRTSWYAAWNIEYYVGVDGISIAMILLTAFVVAAGVLISWKMEVLTKEFFFLLMLLSVGAYGFFISLDLMFLDLLFLDLLFFLKNLLYM